MESKVFSFGGLSVTLWNSAEYGWVTTSVELARAVGMHVKHLRKVIQAHDLIDEEYVRRDAQLGAKMRLSRVGRPDLYLWTAEGMKFAAMFFRTEQARTFRKEVIKTITHVEALGLRNAEQVAETLERMANRIEQLNAKVERQDKEIASLRKGGLPHAFSVKTSFDGRGLQTQHGLKLIQ